MFAPLFDCFPLDDTFSILWNYVKRRKQNEKTKQSRLGVGREMNEGLLMSLCCRDNVNLIIQRAGTSAFAFLTSHDVSAFFFFFSFRALCFSCYWMSLTKRRIWLLLRFVFLIFHDEYVCASMHVFWYYTVDIKCVNVYGSSALHSFSDLVRRRCVSSRKSFASHFPSTLRDGVRRVCFVASSGGV